MIANFVDRVAANRIGALCAVAVPPGQFVEAASAVVSCYHPQGGPAMALAAQSCAASGDQAAADPRAPSGRIDVDSPDFPAVWQVVVSATASGDVPADHVAVDSDLGEGAVRVHLVEGVPAGPIFRAKRVEIVSRHKAAVAHLP